MTALILTGEGYHRATGDEDVSWSSQIGTAARKVVVDITKRRRQLIDIDYASVTASGSFNALVALDGRIKFIQRSFYVRCRLQSCSLNQFAK